MPLLADSGLGSHLLDLVDVVKTSVLGMDCAVRSGSAGISLTSQPSFIAAGTSAVAAAPKKGLSAWLPLALVAFGVGAAVYAYGAEEVIGAVKRKHQDTDYEDLGRRARSASGSAIEVTKTVSQGALYWLREGQGLIQECLSPTRKGAGSQPPTPSHGQDQLLALQATPPQQDSHGAPNPYQQQMQMQQPSWPVGPEHGNGWQHAGQPQMQPQMPFSGVPPSYAPQQQPWPQGPPAGWQQMGQPQPPQPPMFSGQAGF